MNLCWIMCYKDILKSIWMEICLAKLWAVFGTNILVSILSCFSWLTLLCFPSIFSDHYLLHSILLILPHMDFQFWHSLGVHFLDQSLLVHTLQGDLIHTKDFTSELMNLIFSVLIWSSVTGSIFLGSKITADSDCSHEIKRRLFLGRKVITNLDSILKSRDITLPTKVHLVKAMVFSVVMCGCESWTIKKAECWIIDAFELWCWRRLLRVPWTARKSNQSILKEISPLLNESYHSL